MSYFHGERPLNFGTPFTVMTNQEAVAKFVRGFGGDPSKSSPIDVPRATRADLADLFNALGYTTGAEVGVEQGAFSSILLAGNARLYLYCVDAWKAYRGYRDHVRQEKLNRFLETTITVLSDYGAEKERWEIIRAYSMDAVRKFSAGQLDFVYVDANHSFDYIMQDLIEWNKRVKVGGMVCGHDYIRRKAETERSSQCDVVKAVQAYTNAHKIHPWYTTSGDSGEPRSFFWVKD
jgi:hypothetical protein